MSNPGRCRRVLAIAGAVVMSMPLISLGVNPVAAQTANVTSAAQLRSAVTAATTPIVLGQNISLACADGPLEINTATTITSSTGNRFSITMTGDCDRIIEATAALTIDRVNFSGGRAPAGVAGVDDGDGGNGGAILSTANITLTDVRFENNRAGAGADGAGGAPGIDGGAGGSGGAIYTTGNVTATRSVFTNNRAGNGGRGGDGTDGADAADPGDPGVVGGNGGNGGDGGNGGAISAGGSITLTRSTLHANQAGAGGRGGNGGDGGDGGATDQPGGSAGDGGNGGDAGSGGAARANSVTVTTSTLHNNQVLAAGAGGDQGTPGLGGGAGANGGDGDDGDPGAPGAGGAISSVTTISLASSTITENQAAGAAAGISVRAGTNLSSNFTAIFGTGAGNDCAGTLAGGNANNRARDDSCVPVANVIADPGLGALTSGTLPVRIPNQNSPLLNIATCPDTTDQRGLLRPQGSACDIGAIERRAAVSATVAGLATESEIAVGATTTVTFTVTISANTVGRLATSDIEPSITGCTTTPMRAGAAEPFVANDAITWTCNVTTDVASTVDVAYSATYPSGEGTMLTLSASVPIQFAQATTTTTSTTVVPDTTTATTVPDDGGVAGTGTGGGVLPRTGLSILLTLFAAMLLVVGGLSMSRFAQVRAALSPRWGMKYGVPYPTGSHRNQHQNQR